MEYSLRILDGAEETVIPGPEGRSLLAALQSAGIDRVPAPCGGKGRCRKCAVTVSGPVRSLETGETHLAEEETLLSCRYAPGGDCVVTLSGESVLQVVQGGERIAPGGEGLGLAVDIGTTTVAVRLYDLRSGEALASAGERNAQRSFGADVISRITACGEGRLPDLRDRIREQITLLARELCRRAGRDPEEIRKVTIAGNTVMEHLFEGLDPTGIGVAPFTPESLFGDHRLAHEVLPELRRDADVYLCPCVSGYVGGDITAGLAATDGDRTEGLRLYVDIGTNGEMALGNGEGYLTCATAAGPAFEGAEIACGMDGAPGAIDRAWAEDGTLHVHVIGDGPARGLCGSGLIDVIAALLALGVIDETGRLAGREELPAALGERVFTLPDGHGAFLLQDGVYLAARDVRQVQLAKAAIRAGAETLLARLDKTAADITELVIAGGFGSFMDKSSALAIGLLPSVDPDRIRHGGNAAAAGAAEALTAAGEARLAALTEKCAYLELSEARDFMDRYVECMMFEEEEA
ncbi:MAG: DUF4445 domain-containing protein [Oscillospiraceae bacterium]|nr:DUF4445 domain-containing protein [Oscillospiraceae bacterium]